ncbi:MAG: hypothetical protein WAV51_00460 [Microgenomates group bacterium]
MRFTLNQTYEYLTCVLWDVTHKKRNVDDYLIRELFLYARVLPIRGAVIAMDTLFLSPEDLIVAEARKQLPKELLSNVTINRAEKISYIAAVTNILKNTLPNFIKSETKPKEKLKQLQIFLIYSTIDRPRQELEEAQQALTDLFITTPASPLDALHTNCIKLLDER